MSTNRFETAARGIPSADATVPRAAAHGLRSRRVAWGLILLTLQMFFAARPIRSEETTPAVEDAPPAPLLVVQVSALDRVLHRMHDNLMQVDRQDVDDAFVEFLESNAGGLQGIDRSQPFGMAMFLPESLPPRPVSVVFAPVTSFDDLIQTLELGPVTVKRQKEDPNDSGEDRFTLTMQRGGTREIVVRDGYAFMSRNEEFLDGDVASLAKLAPRLSEQYDIAATLDLTTISPIVRDVFLGFLRNRAQAELQRRDDEPLPRFIVRKANGLSTLELIEYVLRDGESLTLGLETREDSANTILELNIEAAPGSEFARYLADLAGHPTSYASLVNDREPLTLSASWKMSPREQRLGREWISSLAHGMTDRLASAATAGDQDAALESGGGASTADGGFVPHASVQSIINTLNATVDAGDFDLCVQFRELEPGRFGLIGAMQVVGGETLAGGLRELLTALQVQGADFDITQDVADHREIAIHRVRSRKQEDRERRVYGADSALHVGASSRTLWFAIGSPRILTELKIAIDRLAEASSQPPSRQAPIRFLLQAEPWLNLSPDEDDENALQRRERLDEAFDIENDGLTLEVRPTENGARVRVELEPGFARLFTLWIAERYDRSQL